MRIRLSPVLAFALLAPLSGCFMWPSTNVAPPSWSEPPVEGNAYTPGQPSVNPEIQHSRPGVTATTLAGSGASGGLDGSGTDAQFHQPEGVAIGTDGTLYVAEPYAYRIRRIAPDGRVSTVAGGSLGRTDGTGAEAKFFGPKDMIVQPDGNLIVVDFDHLRHVTPDGRVTTMAVQTADGPWQPVELLGIARGSDGSLYVSTTTGIDRIKSGVASRWVGADAKGFRDGNGTSAYFNLPRKLVVDGQDNLYVADFGNLRVRKVSPTRQVTTVAGNGILGFTDGTSARSRLNFPTGIALDAQGNVLIADTYNHAVRMLSPDGNVTTLAGNNTAGFKDGAASTIQFNHPTDLAVGADGKVYVADWLNHRIRVLR